MKKSIYMSMKNKSEDSELQHEEQLHFLFFNFQLMMDKTSCSLAKMTQELRMFSCLAGSDQQLTPDSPRTKLDTISMKHHHL